LRICPSAQDIIELIREHSISRREDEMRFVDALIFNWLISGTDAHAKNYSFLIAPGQVRLSPLYDLSSTLPYARQIAPRDANLAMKVGGKYKLLTIGAPEWKKCAAELRIDSNALRDRIGYFTKSMPHTARKVYEAVKAQGIKHNVLDRLVDALAKRARFCEEAMGW
jgi:serine/threonine-protein kinase HipA